MAVLFVWVKKCGERQSAKSGILKNPACYPGAFTYNGTMTCVTLNSQALFVEEAVTRETNVNCPGKL